MAIWQGGHTVVAWPGLLFKRVSEGWILRSPICWWPFGLGPVRHYLVNDTQKAEIVRLLGHWRVRAILLFLWLLGIVPLIVLLRNVLVRSGSPELVLLILLPLFVLWVQGVSNVVYSLTLRSTLASARRTSERITFVEELSAHMRYVRVWIFFGFVSTLVCGLLAFQALILRTLTIGLLIGMVITGLFAIYFFTLVTMKLKAKQSY